MCHYQQHLFFPFMHPLLIHSSLQLATQSSIILHSRHHMENAFCKPLGSSWARSGASCPHPSCIPPFRATFLLLGSKSHDSSSLGGSPPPGFEHLSSDWSGLSVSHLGHKIDLAASSTCLNATRYSYIYTSPGPATSQQGRNLE